MIRILLKNGEWCELFDKLTLLVDSVVLKLLLSLNPRKLVFMRQGWNANTFVNLSHCLAHVLNVFHFVCFSLVLVVLNCVLDDILGSGDCLGLLLFSELVNLVSQNSDISFTLLVFSLLLLQLCLPDVKLRFQNILLVKLGIYDLFFFVELLKQIITCVIQRPRFLLQLLDLLANLVLLLQFFSQEVLQFGLMLLIQLLLLVLLVVEILELLHIDLHLFLLGL